MLKLDIAVLTGTRIRLPEGCSYTVQRLVGYTAIHYGWGRGCYTNRSTGVSILLGKRFQPRMIKEISVPPSSLAGRGGAIRLRGGTIDLGILAYYSPPLGGCSRARRKVQVKASQQLIDWVRNRISSWPSRVFPLAAGHLNSGVGMFRDGTQAEGPSVVNSHLSAQNEAGMSLEFRILNTMWRTGGPTYCGLAGYRSTIDYILAPLSGLGCVKKVVKCWKMERRVQLIPAAHPRDHLPVLVLIALRIWRTGQDQQRAHRWDFDRMATALQQGSTERVAFLKEVDQNLSDQAEQMDRALTAPSAEDSWRLWIHAIVRAGKRFFSHTKALHTTEETRQANRERWAHRLPDNAVTLPVALHLPG